MAVVRGIPSREEYGNLNELNVGELLDYFLQHHVAKVAGPHYDMRFGDKERGLYSWAVPKGMPRTPKQKALAIQQPIHSHAYGHWAGTIPKGYGAGQVMKADQGKVLINYVSPNAIHFTLAHKKYPERFMLVKPKEGKNKNWILVNTTPAGIKLPEKISYKEIPPAEIEPMLQQMNGHSVQAKIDGAAALINLLGSTAEVLSYRTSKVTNEPIVHTERFFGSVPKTKTPKNLVGTVLRGEMYAKSGDKVAPLQSLNSVLNSSVYNALEKKRRDNLQLRAMLFDVEQIGNKPVDKDTVPYAQRLQTLQQILQHLPQNDLFDLPQEAKTPEEAIALWQQIISGQHPLTNEGIVLHPERGKPTKVKHTPEQDVYITGIAPGMGKAMDAGGFHYSLQPDGSPVGVVGSGFSDELRKQMKADPQSFVGRTARIKSMGQFPSGAHRMPILIGLHEG